MSCVASVCVCVYVFPCVCNCVSSVVFYYFADLSLCTYHKYLISISFLPHMQRNQFSKDDFLCCPRCPQLFQGPMCLYSHCLDVMSSFCVHHGSHVEKMFAQNEYFLHLYIYACFSIHVHTHASFFWIKFVHFLLSTVLQLI